MNILDCVQMFKLVCVRILQKRQDFRMYKLYRLWNLRLLMKHISLGIFPKTLPAAILIETFLRIMKIKNHIIRRQYIWKTSKLELQAMATSAAA